MHKFTRFSKLSLTLFFSLSLWLALAGLALAQDPIHVTPTGAGSGNGSNWANATVLTNALTIANPGSQIWVAAGVYTPGLTISDTFTLPPGVAVYGGFAGGETMLSQRSYTANVTILSGDIGGDDLTTNGVVVTPTNIVGNNAQTVVTTNNVTESTRLDGFIITAGLANGNGAFPARTGVGAACSTPMAAPPWSTLFSVATAPQARDQMVMAEQCTTMGKAATVAPA